MFVGLPLQIVCCIVFLSCFDCSALDVEGLMRFGLITFLGCFRICCVVCFSWFALSCVILGVRVVVCC